MRTDFFLPADWLLDGVRPAQEQSRLEDENCAMSVPTSEMIVMAVLRSTPGMVQRRATALSKGAAKEAMVWSSFAIRASRKS